ncbi:hypothetical protein D9M71_376110 [compost metagenome]
MRAILNRGRGTAHSIRDLSGVVIADTAATVPDLLVLHFGIVAPDFLTGVRIHREDLVQRGADVKRVAHLNRSILVFRTCISNLSGTERPGHLKVGNVLWGDLLKRCEPRSSRRTSIMLPVAVYSFIGRATGDRRTSLPLDNAMWEEHRDEAGDEQH